MFTFFGNGLGLLVHPPHGEDENFSNHVIILRHTVDFANVYRNGTVNDTEKAPKRHRKSIENAGAHAGAFLERRSLGSHIEIAIPLCLA